MLRSLSRFVLFAIAVLVVAACGEGSQVDAGTDARAPATDAAASTDSGPTSDAGRQDAGSSTDGGGAVDAATPADGGPPGSLDPSLPGSRTTSTQTDTVRRGARSTPVTAYVPDGAATPLVIFAPGFQIQSSAYEPTLQHVASHGFTVVRADPSGSAFAPNHVAMRDDLVAVIDWALSELSPAPGVLVMGHSLGGKLATMVAGADSRVTAMVGIDPVNGGSPFLGYTANLPDVVPAVTTTLRIPVAYLGETTNGSGGIGGMACAPTDQNYQTFYEGTDGAPVVYEHTFVGADHIDFLDTSAGCGLACSACTAGTADSDEVSSSTRTLLTAFALRHLSAVTSVEDVLTGARAVPGVTVRSR